MLKSRDPHSCPVCKKLLSSRGNLAKHMIQHQTVKPWVCKMCGSGFNSKRDHNYHYMQRHTMLRPNVCNICGKGYANKRTLTEHMVFHKKEKEFKCKLCGKSFSTKKCVSRHMQRHETNAKFECNLCFKAFRVKVDFYAHLKLMHSSEKKKKPKSLANKSSKNSNPLKRNPSCQGTNTNKNTQVSQSSSASTFVQTEMPVAPSSDQQAHKLKELSDLLQTNSNSLLQDIGNEFQAVSLTESDARETLFINGENMSTQTIIPVATVSEENASNNSLSMYKLPSKTGHDSIDTSGIFVMIGLGEAENGIKSKRSWTAAPENEKKDYHNQSEEKQVDSSQRVYEVSLLPTVIEEMSRAYPDGMDQELGKYGNSSTPENAVLPKVTKKINFTSTKAAGNDKGCAGILLQSNLNFKPSDGGQVTFPHSQSLNLDLLSQSLQLDIQQQQGNEASGLIKELLP